jgi:SAM-dependent methyltransferase
MRARRQREVWESLGREDADWGVLTVRDRRHQGWQRDLEAFYAHGREAGAECLKTATPPAYNKALDYGAGTGRLSFALSARFARVTAVDVSPGMLATLSGRARTRSIANIEPLHADEFDPQADHDFAISLLVLQHLPSLDDVARAIARIAAALRPGGVAVIEVPERALLLRARLQPRLRAYGVLRTMGLSPGRLHRLGFSGISMLVIEELTARRLLGDAGLDVIKKIHRPDPDYTYARWVVQKPDARAQP